MGPPCLVEGSFADKFFLEVALCKFSLKLCHVMFCVQFLIEMKIRKDINDEEIHMTYLGISKASCH